MEDLINILFIIGSIIAVIISATRKNRKTKQPAAEVLQQDPLRVLFEELLPPETATESISEETSSEKIIDEEAELIKPESVSIIPAYQPLIMPDENPDETTETVTGPFSGESFNAKDAVIYSEIFKPIYF